MSASSFRLSLFGSIAVLASFAIAPLSSQAALILSGGGLTLVSEGGAIGAGNLATAGTAFALDELGLGTHFTVNANNGTFGNSSSWIGDLATEVTSHGSLGFIGISLGATPIPLGGFAFGRDNLPGLTDRTLGTYVLQYTQVANPTSVLTETGNPVTGFADIGTLDYGAGVPATDYAFPSQRHEFTFNTKFATGLRLLVPAVGIGAGTAIDEFEIFSGVVPEPSTFLLVTFALGLAGSRRVYRARHRLNLRQVAAFAVMLTVLLIAPAADAGLVITPSAGYNITWDGNDGDYFSATTGTPVPNNLALASNGATPFADPALVLPHEISDLNNGIYGNTNAYIGTGANRTGIALAQGALVSSIAWGRDNGADIAIDTGCAGGQCNDRSLGVYTLYRTTVASPGLATAITGDAATGWDQIGTINYVSNDDTVVGSLFTSYFRHEFELTFNGGPLAATAFRMDVPSGAAIDEIELFAFQTPEPSTLSLLGLGLIAFASRRRRNR